MTVGVGVAALLAYSVAGPLLASVGAGAVLAGVVTAAGEPLIVLAMARRHPISLWRKDLPHVPLSHLVFAGVSALGLAGFGLLSFHAVRTGLLAPAVAPLTYAGALLTGLASHRWGPRALLALPPVAVLVPVLGFSSSTALAVIGVLSWGIALGVLESRLRAARGAVFAVVLGVATAVGGVLGGVLYAWSVSALVIFSVACQMVALAVLGYWVERAGRGRLG
ncbi:hypothetical protein EV193_1011064 [Herbihabitans rhizosphaerae]|uniref:Uncharacterized protein n=1 Tax=Herbihabitans rhizosphaerae TaxID=1872711 RepID=A0A4Q7L733_9PSEU|nr:hypothetical protein [Herbihabitans rhizosphaerae]RZS45177.1 hypothetical protein EV193_1011064 [Herbihabitans rhizosphaerae]